ncbi:MAG: hypothetical protein GX654_01735 [Desulfatiglans sp.]|nr:hypothetical protein [Desulfatiglans sp.]
MTQQRFQNKYKKYYMLLCLIILFSGCATNKKVYSEFAEGQVGPLKIVFLGLRSGIPEGGSPALFSNPLLNTMVSAEPVNHDISDRLSDKLYTLIEESRDYNMVNVKGHQIPGYNSANPLDINSINTLAKEISADFVITGYVYRMQEREGGKYSAVTPASTAFDIYFIDVKNGTISWRGSYDKTQKSLSENLLDFKSFLKLKGKWADVESLALAGLKELVDDMPKIKK